MEKRDIYFLLISIGIVVAFFLTRWLIVGAFFGGDLVINTIPLENLYAHIQRNGQSPLWAPELAGGYPLLANGQLGYWYPPHMVLRQFLPGVLSLNISLLLHAILGTIGVYLLLKENKISGIATSSAAILIPLGAAMVGKYQSFNLILPFMWAPFLLWLLQIFITRGDLKYFVLWLGANAWCIFVGHPQMAIYVTILELIFLLCLTRLSSIRWRRALALLPGIILVLCLTSIYWLPIWDNIPNTDRANGTNETVAKALNLVVQYA